jgi:hypothetical protein
MGSVYVKVDFQDRRIVSVGPARMTSLRSQQGTYFESPYHAGASCQLVRRLRNMARARLTASNGVASKRVHHCGLPGCGVVFMNRDEAMETA